MPDLKSACPSPKYVQMTSAQRRIPCTNRFGISKIPQPQAQKLMQELLLGLKLVCVILCQKKKKDRIA